MTTQTVSVAEAWLLDVLAGDATLVGLVGSRFVSTLAPVGNLALPCVSWSLMSSRDITAVGGEIIDTESIYLVKAIVMGASWTPAEPIADRIHTLIHGKSVTFSGTSSLTCVRDRIHQRPEEVGGQQYRHLGGMYKIRAI